MTALFFVLGGSGVLSFWLMIPGLLIDVFIYSILEATYKKGSDGLNILIAALSPLSLIVVIVYLILLGIYCLYKKPVKYLAYKINEYELETFLNKYDIYSQFMNVVHNELNLTFKEFICYYEPDDYLNVICCHDNTFKYYRTLWKDRHNF